MKRVLKFEVTEDAYIIREENIVFQIAFDDLKFDSREFYCGIYADGKSPNIELENAVSSQNPKAPYVYRWLNEIIQNIREELCSKDDEEKSELIGFPSKQVILYDMAICAGVGDFIDNPEYSGKFIETSLLDADYALRISGQSMEPTLMDKEIILVKKEEEFIDGQIFVVSVDGNFMVKRYRSADGKALLIPDNGCGKYETIPLDGKKDVRVQARVIGIQCEDGTEKHF